MRQGDVIIVGAGIIGLCCAYQGVKNGRRVTVIDPSPAGDRASLGNAGGIAVTEVVPASVPGLWRRVPGWLFDPLGPLSLRPTHLPRMLPWLREFARVGQRDEMIRISAALASLNGRVYDDLLPLLRSIGLQNDLVRNGAITVYESPEGFNRDRDEWALKRAHGIEAHVLSIDEVRKLEPDLGGVAAMGVFTPQWSHVTDPAKICITLLAWLRRSGVTIREGHVKHICPNHERPRVALADNTIIEGRDVIVAAGSWSAPLAESVGDRVLLESERGYNTTFANPGIRPQREIIFGERKFVATPLSVGLRIGGAAEFGGLVSRPNYKRSQALARLAKLYFPGLQLGGPTEWSGHRPATPDSLPVIGPSPKSKHVIYAFGHGHLGLTHAATTGAIVGDLISDRLPETQIAPFSIDRFRK